MKFTYTKSQFEMPDGRYLAKFLGVTLKELQPGESPRLGMDGKPMPPAMTWDFEIVEGEQKGKKADKLTGRIPTPKSGCGKMLAAIADTMLKDGVEVDIANYTGKLYRITIFENRVTDAPAPQRVYDYDAATGNPTSAPAKLWDVSDGQNVMPNQTTDQVKTFLADVPKDAAIRVKPAGSSRENAKPVGEWPEFKAETVPF